MEPLDVFVFGHKPTEMVFSLNTSDYSFKRVFICYSVLIAVLLFGLYYYKKLNINVQHFKKFQYIGFISLIVFFYFDIYGKLPVASDLIKNKSYYFYTNILKDRTTKLLDQNLEKFSTQYQEKFIGPKYLDQKYPFLHQFETEEKLSNYLDSFSSPPNIIILLTESLSEYFIHPIRGMHFMPFLDSLSKVSLYWPNALSLGERSFAANPAITAAVPYGEIGFSLMETYPYHFSLINVLRKNHYYTSFYYGQGAWFHNKKHFFSFNNTDRIIDKNSFDPKFNKILIGDEQNFWGYHDADLFGQYLMATDSLLNHQRLDLIFTGTSHSPFIIKNPEVYNARFNKDLEKITNPEDLEHFKLYKKYYLSLYSVDDAYRTLFASLKSREDFDNSIIILTGDHAMTELPRMNALQPYKVPLMIYSPKLKLAQKMEALCSHNDLYETLLAYLHNNFNLELPKQSTALGHKINFEKQFENKGTYVFMNNNRQIVDIYEDGYYLFKNKYLFKVYEDLEIREVIDPSITKKLRTKLEIFSAASLMASKHNALMPDSLFFNFFGNQVYYNLSKVDSVITLSDNYSIASINIPQGKEIYCDLSFDVESETTSFPKIKLEWADSSEHTLQTNELVFPSEKTNYQFHYPVQAPVSGENYIKLKIYFDNPTKDTYTFKNPKYCIYSK